MAAMRVRRDAAAKRWLCHRGATAAPWRRAGRPQRAPRRTPAAAERAPTPCRCPPPSAGPRGAPRTGRPPRDSAPRRRRQQQQQQREQLRPQRQRRQHEQRHGRRQWQRRVEQRAWCRAAGVAQAHGGAAGQGAVCWFQALSVSAHPAFCFTCCSCSVHTPLSCWSFAPRPQVTIRTLEVAAAGRHCHPCRACYSHTLTTFVTPR